MPTSRVLDINRTFAAKVHGDSSQNIVANLRFVAVDQSQYFIRDPKCIKATTREKERKKKIHKTHNNTAHQVNVRGDKKHMNWITFEAVLSSGSERIPSQFVA